MAGEFNKYPYTNFHELNLEYFIKKFDEIFTQWSSLYDTMIDWKTDTTAELEAWKTSVEDDLDARETALRAELEAWKDATEADISDWEVATLAALDDWKDAAEAAFEVIRIQAAASATEATNAATAAGNAKTAAETAQAAAEAAAASVAASAAQIAENTSDIADLGNALEEVDDAVFVGDTERNITTKDDYALPQASVSVNIGELLSMSKVYRIRIVFSDYPGKLSSIQTATSTSSSTVVDTLTTSKNTEYDLRYIPTAQNIRYIRFNFASSYTGDLTVDIVVDEIEIQRDTAFYTKPQIDVRIKPANRFNLDTCTCNAGLSTITGEVIDNTTKRAVSDFINVTGHSTITFSHRAYRYVFYNSSKEFVSTDTMAAAGTIDIPSGVTYIRFVFGVDDVNNLVVTFDDETTTELRSGYYSEDYIVRTNVNKEIAENNLRNKYVTDENILKSTSIVSVNSGFCYFDTVYYGSAEKSLKMVCTNGVTEGRVYLSTAQAVLMNGVYAFKFHVYVTGSSNIESITWYGTQSAEAISGGISITVSTTGLKDGWNTLYAYTYRAGSFTNWTNYQYFTFRMIASGDCTIYIAEIIPQRSENAKLIVVDDHGYQPFLNEAYPGLKALGIPTTWAIRWGLLGEEVAGWGTQLTEAQIETLADDPYSEFSFHSWSGGSMESATDAQNRTNMQKCISAMMTHHVMPLHMWRAAWVQNLAANVSGIYDMLEGSATYNESSTYTSVPFPSIYNIPRIQLHSSNRTQDWFDSFFDRLKKTHCAAIVYTHSVVADDSEYAAYNITQSQIGMFLDGCETGVTEGWLKGTTFSWEMTKYYAEKYKKDTL